MNARLSYVLLRKAGRIAAVAGAAGIAAPGGALALRAARLLPGPAVYGAQRDHNPRGGQQLEQRGLGQRVTGAGPIARDRGAGAGACGGLR